MKAEKITVILIRRKVNVNCFQVAACLTDLNFGRILILMNLPLSLPLASAILIAAASFSHAQINRIFNNLGGDRMWNNSGNWVRGEIAENSGEYVQLNANVYVDQNVTVNRIQNSFGASINLGVSGLRTLTLDPIGGNGYAIRNVSNNGADLQFSGNVTINQTNGGISKIGYNNGTGNTITFVDGSTLNLTTQIETETGSHQFLHFNGRITGGNSGVGGIRIAANDRNITFGATADNTGYRGDIVFFAHSEVLSQSTVTGGFLDTGSKIQVNGNGGSLTLDGADAMRGNVVIGADNAFTIKANSDQPSMGFLNLKNGSNLHIIIDPTVSELAFSDSSSIAWGTGIVSITNFREKTIRFGTDSMGLTRAQLAQIDGGIYRLTVDGYLSKAKPE